MEPELTDNGLTEAEETELVAICVRLEELVLAVAGRDGYDEITSYTHGYVAACLEGARKLLEEAVI